MSKTSFTVSESCYLAHTHFLKVQGLLHWWLKKSTETNLPVQYNILLSNYYTWEGSEINCINRQTSHQICP